MTGPNVAMEHFKPVTSEAKIMSTSFAQHKNQSVKVSLKQLHHGEKSSFYPCLTFKILFQLTLVKASDSSSLVPRSSRTALKCQNVSDFTIHQIS